MSDAVAEQRLARLEQDGRDFRDDVKSIRPELSAIRSDQALMRADLAYIRGRLEMLPTTWAMLTGIIGGQIALAGLLIAAARLFGVH